jgi:membrane protease YdiL (CAAX protease family)
MILSPIRLRLFFLNNSIAFILAISLINVLVIKIPFEKIFQNSFPFESSKNISRIIQGLILIFFSVTIIKIFSLKKLAGVKLFHINRPALLFLPIVYPMSLGIPNLFGLELNQANWVSIFLVFLAMISKGLAEEFTFRSLLQSYLISKYSNKLSILQIVCISAAFFALMHISNITRYEFVDVINQVIGAFFFGVFFGAMLIKTANVFVLGVLHGCINFVFKAGSLGRKTDLDNDRYLYSVPEILSVIAKYTLVFSPLLIMGILLLRKL